MSGPEQKKTEKIWKKTFEKPKETKTRPSHRAGHPPPKSSHNNHRALIGTINATTLKENSKLVTTAMMVKTLGQIFCGITETHRTGTENFEEWPEMAELTGWKFINSGMKKQAYGGVGLLISPEVELVDNDFEVIDQGRILRAKIIYRGVKLIIHVVYGPTNASKNSSDAMRTNFWNNLSKSIDDTRKRYPKCRHLTLGDTNATLGPDAPMSDYIGHNNLDQYSTTDNGYRMIEFLDQQNLYALNTLFNTKRKCHRITWKLGRASKRLDYFLADRWLRNCCMSARAYPSVSGPFETNHFMVMAEFRFPGHKQRQKIFKKVEKKPKKPLTTIRDDPEIRTTFSDAFDTALAADTNPSTTADEIEQKLSKALEKASETLPTVLADGVYNSVTKNFFLPFARLALRASSAHCVLFSALRAFWSAF